jgi:hypothetical protein
MFKFARKVSNISPLRTGHSVCCICMSEYDCYRNNSCLSLSASLNNKVGKVVEPIISASSLTAVNLLRYSLTQGRSVAAGEWRLSVITSLLKNKLKKTKLLKKFNNRQTVIGKKQQISFFFIRRISYS